MDGGLVLNLAPVDLLQQGLPPRHEVAGMIAVDDSWPPVGVGVDHQLGQEGAGAVVRTEESINCPGIETRDNEDPSFHLCPLSSWTGDQEGSTVVDDNVREGLNRSLKQFLGQVRDPLLLMLLLADLAVGTRGDRPLAEVAGVDYPGETS